MMRHINPQHVFPLYFHLLTFENVNPRFVDGSATSLAIVGVEEAIKTSIISVSM